MPQIKYQTTPLLLRFSTMTVAITLVHLQQQQVLIYCLMVYLSFLINKWSMSLVHRSIYCFVIMSGFLVFAIVGCCLQWHPRLLLSAMVVYNLILSCHLMCLFVATKRHIAEEHRCMIFVYYSFKQSITLDMKYKIPVMSITAKCKCAWLTCYDHWLLTDYYYNVKVIRHHSNDSNRQSLEKN